MKSRCVWRKPLCLPHHGWKFLNLFFHSCDVCRYAYSNTHVPGDLADPQINLNLDETFQSIWVFRPRPFLVSSLQYTLSHIYSYTNTYIYLEWYVYVHISAHTSSISLSFQCVPRFWDGLSECICMWKFNICAYDICRYVYSYSLQCHRIFDCTEKPAGTL